jgi:flagellar hook-associated protein 1 FlgK
MTSIFDGFDTVKQTLALQQFGLSISQKNIANANNPAYSKEEVLFSEAEVSTVTGGVPEASVRAYRQRYIDYSISQELQLYEKQTTSYEALQQIDAILNESSSAGLQSALSDFFNSFSALANKPEDLTLRQQVLTCARTLSSEFKRIYENIQQVQTAQDRSVAETVDDINSITAKIAELNKLIPPAQATHSPDEFTLRDEMQQYLEKLSNLTDISYFETENGSITVTTKQGGLLVAGDQYRALEAAPKTTGPFLGVWLDGVEITSTIQSGKLGASLDIRDKAIPDYLDVLDNLAAEIIDRVNTQNAVGNDLNGAPGTDIFTPFVQVIPGSNNGAARAMNVTMTDPQLIAAAGPVGGPGDNENAKLLAAIKDEKLFSGATETINQYYAGLVYRVGSDEKKAQDGITTQQYLLDQLNNQRESFSGVNMDEEAVNIVKYQKAYQAGARMMSVLNSLCDDLLNILGN